MPQGLKKVSRFHSSNTSHVSSIETKMFAERKRKKFFLYKLFLSPLCQIVKERERTRSWEWKKDSFVDWIIGHSRLMMKRKMGVVVDVVHGGRRGDSIEAATRLPSHFATFHIKFWGSMFSIFPHIEDAASSSPTGWYYLLKRDYFLISSHPQFQKTRVSSSVTRLGDLLDFGQLFKAFGNN